MLGQTPLTHARSHHTFVSGRCCPRRAPPFLILPLLRPPLRRTSPSLECPVRLRPLSLPSFPFFCVAFTSSCCPACPSGPSPARLRCPSHRGRCCCRPRCPRPWRLNLRRPGPLPARATPCAPARVGGAEALGYIITRRRWVSGQLARFSPPLVSALASPFSR